MLTPSLMVKDMEKTLDFYTQTLGFEEVMRFGGPDGQIVHAHVQWKEANIMFGPAQGWLPAEALPHLGTGLNLYIMAEADDDIDQYYNMVKEKGVTIVQEIEDQFWGDRTFTIKDPDGYQLTFGKHVRDVPEEEMQEALKQMM